MPKLPDFQTDEEVIAWFDSHDTAPYLAGMAEADETFPVLRTVFNDRLLARPSATLTPSLPLPRSINH